MPIHYRNLTVEYRDVPIRELRFGVEDAEHQFRLFLSGEISAEEFSFETGWFSSVYRYASVSEVFSDDSVISEQAQDLVNRSEMMQRVRDLIFDHWPFDDNGGKDVAKEDNYKQFCTLVVTLEPGDKSWDGAITLQDLPQLAF